jgi:tRNA A58 N-methylase Trm61
LSTLRLDGRDNRYVSVQYPSLEQYISMTRRNVTPIYASYANTIVYLLDLHATIPLVEAEGHDSPKSVEILEAGTGHGSLTIHLARAIAAANAPQPRTALPCGRQTSKKHHEASPEEAGSETDGEWSHWFRLRRAVVHTVEKVSRNSIDAEKLIRGFRQGIYWPHVDFYAGDVDAWIDSQLDARKDHEPGFLSHVILDMPAVEQMIPKAASAMREEAKLAVFCPSITQIAECQKLIRDQCVPLVFEKVLELGEGISTGRTWDVRVVTPRKVLAAKELVVEEPSEDSPSSGSDEAATPEELLRVDEPSTTPNNETRFVCRPKVGELIVGGGFLGLWRKSTFKKNS